MVLLGLDEVVATVSDFAARLVAEEVRLNELNVFPVADGDTGTNMVHTLLAILDSLEGVGDIGGVAAAVEGAALDGRGNSGLIIGQFLAGFVAASDGEAVDLTCGVTRGANRARMAVASPVEGTILTVADAAAAHLSGGGDAGLGDEGLDDLVAAVRFAVDATPSQLPLLAERGVVDSGAAGLLCFFEAIRSVVGRPVVGERAERSPVQAPVIACDVGLDAGQGRQAAAYEIQFRVASEVVGADELSRLLLGLGTDVVVASSAVERSAHVHVPDPHTATAAISAALETVRGAKAISYDVEPIREVNSDEGEAS